MELPTRARHEEAERETEEKMTTRAFTIDGTQSMDLDDAFRVTGVTDDAVTIEVTIAAVAPRVQKGSPVDLEAAKRVETRYYYRGNHPMLPRNLSEHEVSLLPGRRRRGFTMTIRVAGDTLQGTLQGIQITEFRSLKKLAYADVPRILDDPEHDLYQDLVLCRQVAERLLENRRDRGALALYDLLQGWVTTEEGSLKRVERDEANIGYVIVQEMMILANGCLAQWCAKESIPVLYRNHTAKAHAPDRAVWMGLLQQTAAGPLTGLQTFQSQVALTMNRATYGPTLEGHYGLNLPVYIHATSPIRRYADLVTQRQIMAHLGGRELPHTHEELVALAQQINDWKVKQKEDTAGFLKGRAESQAEGALSHANRLGSLGAAKFGQVVKMAVQGDKRTPEFDGDFRRRLRRGELPPKDMYRVLFQSTWEDLKTEIIQAVAQRPHEAVSVFNIALQQGQPEATITDREEPGTPSPRFFAQGVWEDHTTPKVEAATVKAAQQQAATILLAMVSGVGPPSFETPPKVEPLLAPEGDPVSALQEWCQAQKKPAPNYIFKRVGGTDTVPLWEAICTLGNKREAVEGAAKKKVLKKLAAAKMLEALAGA